MAFFYFNGSLKEVRKFRGGEKCDKCSAGIVIGWAIYQLFKDDAELLNKYCYTCTRNKWSKAMKFYKESFGE